MSALPPPHNTGRTGPWASAILGFLGRAGLVLAGLGILAIPDWTGFRVSRFRWEDYAGIYALAGFMSAVLGLVLARLWAALFDAGSADHPEIAEPSGAPSYQPGGDSG